ncbi:hypothetical protein M436DRAFT_50559 [Aureobasidium namibiae CBS 147.97]|uniref:Protein kinase domain-containing protein n=1 Tax=Aureobasidium namibiae CBS 147.97 TaxID=1043004 RepID=A0A074WJC8_9PEZI
MAPTIMSCAIRRDGSLVKTKSIIGRGVDGFVLHSNGEATVLKIPRLYGDFFPDGTMKPEADNEYANDLSSEQAIYERLNGVPGVARYLGATGDGLLLEYYKNGSLEDYMEKTSPPEWSQKRDWILQIMDVYAACHAKRVLVYDIALRNLLLADDYTIRAIEFANSGLYPLDSTGELKDGDGYTSMMDTLHVTNIIYSLCTWKKFQTDCIQMSEWPKAEELPSTSGVPLGSVIARSWSRQFKTLYELRHAVVSSFPVEPASSWS